MRAWIVSFSGGVFVASYIPYLPDPRFYLLLFLPLLCVHWWRCLFLAAAFCLGIFWLLLIAQAHEQKLLPRHLEQQPLHVTGYVKGLPGIQDAFTRFRFQAETVCLVEGEGECHSPGQTANISLLLSDYSANQYLPGQRASLVVRMKRPHGFANPGTYDYERWLFAQGISATGYVQAATIHDDYQWSVSATMDRFRYRFHDQLERLPLQARAFMAALSIGVRDNLDDDQWLLLSRTGTNHLMVISGLHLGLVCWLVYQVALRTSRLIRWRQQGLPAPRLAAALALVAGVVYAGIAGFSLPVQRALVMAVCLMSGHILIRQTRPLNNLCLALLMVLLLDPMAIRSTGFWLSFAAVALLLGCIRIPQEETQGLGQRITLSLKTQGILFLGLMPLMLVLFGQFSVLAPLVNLLAIPFIGLCVVPLCLVSLALCLLVPAWGSHVIFLPDWLLLHFQQALQWLSDHTGFALVSFPALPWWWLLLTVITLAIIARYRHWLAWSALCLVLLGAYHYQPKALPEGEFTVDVLDAGQGLSVVIRTRSHLVVYDTGPTYSPEFNAGSSIVTPFLKQQNFGSPDIIMVSHGDNDHAGGLASLQASFPHATYFSGEILHSLLPMRACRSGQGWHWNQVQFTVMSPNTFYADGNNASCVLKVSTGSFSLLLPGDIERDTELALVRQYRQQLAADILVAPHHGSTTSSTPPFVRQVSPDHVVFTTGYLNRFGHPRQQVLNRYQLEGSMVHNTAGAGAVHFHVSAGKGITEVSHYRDTHPRFWFAKP